MKLFLLFASVFVVGSCSIQKRLHQPGFHIEWKKRYTANNESEEKVRLNFSSKEDFLAEELFYPILDSNLHLQQRPFKLEQLEKELVERNNVTQYFTEYIKEKETNKFKNRSVYDKYRKYNNLRDEKKTRVGPIDFFVIIISLIFLVTLVAGICAIIFGQHWIWLVLGIILLLFTVYLLIVISVLLFEFY